VNPQQLAIHTFTNQPWSIGECIENYSRSGIGGISIWRETIAGQDLKKVRTQLTDSGLTPVSLVRGGFFTALSAPDREKAIDQNLQALEEAEMVGLPMIVLVCGATVGQSPEQNFEQIEAGIRAPRPLGSNSPSNPFIRCMLAIVPPLLRFATPTSLHNASTIHSSESRLIPFMSGGKPT
jgi:hypothetical protein